MDTTTKTRGQSGGFLWGPRRVNSRIGIRTLADASGVSRGMISLMEHGRLTPTAAEYARIVGALDRLEEQT